MLNRKYHDQKLNVKGMSVVFALSYKYSVWSLFLINIFVLVCKDCQWKQSVKIAKNVLLKNCSRTRFNQ